MSSLFSFARRRRTPDPKVGVAAAPPPPPSSVALDHPPSNDRLLSDMPGALLVVTGDGVVELAHGQSEAILGGEPPAGAAVHEVLGIPDDGAAGMLQLWLASVVGQDLESWDIHVDDAPQRGLCRLPDGTTSPLALEVSPLVVDGLVARALVHVRIARSEAATAAPALAGVGPSPEQLETFACEAHGLVADCQASFERLVADPAARHAVHRLFRSLHTLKGNARTFGVTSVQDSAHVAEEYLAEVRGTAEPVGPDALAEIDAHLLRVRTALEAAVAVSTPKQTVVRHCDEIDVLVRALDAVCRNIDDPDALEELALRADAAGLHGLALATQVARSRRDHAARNRLTDLAVRLRPLVRELRDSALPQHFIAELGCALDDIRRLRVEADSDEPYASYELMSALAGLGHAAAAMGIESVRVVAHRAQERLELGGALDSVDSAVSELAWLHQLGRELAPRLPIRTRVDVLGMFHEEARRLVSQMERALELWQASPRGPQALQAIMSLCDQAASYRACVRRFQLTALAEQAQDIRRLLHEARLSARPQRSLAARVEQWIAELDSHLTLYQGFQVELRAAGPRALELIGTLAAAAARASAGDDEERRAALATIAAIAEEAGLLSVGTALGENSAAAPARVLRLCADAGSFTVEPAARAAKPKESPRGAAVLAAARAFELALATTDPSAAECLGGAWRALRRAIDGLQRTPVASLADRLGRSIAEIAQALGKEVILEVDAEAAEADEAVLRRLDEMLLHAGRNAVDHGIERPDERVAAGKPACGTVSLRARTRGTLLRVELVDDGRGVDLERVKARARCAHLLSPEAAARASAADLLDLLFEPGFSTASEVTAISGRGVGMDAVRALAVEIGGSAVLESTPGRGTRLVIDLPTRSVA